MGTSNSPAELARKLANAGRLIEDANRRGLMAGGQHVKNTAIAQLAAAGVNGRMSGVGRNGARVSVRYTVVKAAADESAVRVKVNGPVHLIERDTKPHEITPRRRGRKSKALRLANGDVRARVIRHPGTTGKHPWEKALKQALPDVPKTIQAQVHSSLRRAFN